MKLGTGKITEQQKWEPIINAAYNDRQECKKREYGHAISCIRVQARSAKPLHVGTSPVQNGMTCKIWYASRIKIGYQYIYIFYTFISKPNCTGWYWPLPNGFTWFGQNQFISNTKNSRNKRIILLMNRSFTDCLLTGQPLRPSYAFRHHKNNNQAPMFID